MDKPVSDCTSKKIDDLDKLLLKHNIDITRQTIHISKDRLLDFIDDLRRNQNREN
jgi:hypothetical protein